MATTFVNKPSFVVSVTPKGTVSNQDNITIERTDLHENVRKTLGGAGEITGNDNTIDGGWANGVNTAITSNGGSHGITFDSAVNLLFIKHTGFLFGTTNVSAATDTVQVKHDGDIIAELANGEAIVLPRPSALVLTFTSGDNHVGVEVCCIGT